MAFGVSFIPSEAEQMQRQQEGGRGGAVQEAVKLLSLKLPTVQGSGAFSPLIGGYQQGQSILQGDRGGMDIEALLRMLYGQGQSGAPTPRVLSGIQRSRRPTGSIGQLAQAQAQRSGIPVSQAPAAPAPFQPRPQAPAPAPAPAYVPPPSAAPTAPVGTDYSNVPAGGPQRYEDYSGGYVPGPYGSDFGSGFGY